MQSVVKRFDEPDYGLWEIRGEPKFFVHSRVMMWAALDRAVQAAEAHGFKGPVHHWRSVREQLREEILSRGVVDGHFVQHYDTDEVDASLLLLPQVGFCATDDPRMLATVAKIERDLMHHGFLRRYRTDIDARDGSVASHESIGPQDRPGSVDGLPGSESPFLVCSFWLVEHYACTNRLTEAHELMDRLCALANDVGLLSEEYDPVARRQVGNFPQAFSHLALVRAADALARANLKPR